MNFKKMPFSIEEKNSKDLINKKEYPTIADLMNEQNIPRNKKNSVHQRRDLDSIG